MTAEAIITALGGRRGRCACPSCRESGRDRGGDHLAVRDGGGRVLVHCFAGCGQESVIASLRARGLWPKNERPELTRAQRRKFAEARESAAEDARRAWLWRIGAAERLNEMKRAAVDFEGGRMDWQALEAAATAARELESGGPGTILQAWRRAWAEDAETAAADEAAGQEHERLGVLFARLVAGLPVEWRAAA